MKYTLFTILLLCNIAFISAQQLGSIKLNNNFSATCEFSTDIKKVYISNNELTEIIRNGQESVQRTKRLYDYVIDEKTVIFSAFEKRPTKSVTIKLTDGSTWYGILEYDQANQKIYYPFYQKRERKATNKTKNEENDSLSTIKKRLNYCLTNETSFNPFGINKNRIFWEVSNIMTDRKYTYIKILVNNNSGHVFEISNGKAIFEYKEGKSRNLKKKEASIREDGFVAYQDAPAKINSYSTEILGYVVESYPLNRKGKLVISFIESTGKRNYEIKIPFKYLEKVEVFND